MIRVSGTAVSYLPVRFGVDPEATFAIVDTGAPWCILSPTDASIAGIDYRAVGEEGQLLLIRGSIMNGWLCLDIPIRIDAIRGEGITVPSTVFVPELEPGQIWDLPNFLGLSGFLERIRFAVDPGNNLFYFGAMEYQQQGMGHERPGLTIPEHYQAGS
jgi:hypothetical protein